MKYDSTSDTILGDKLMLFATAPKEGEPAGTEILPVAFGTSCGIEMSADTIETSNKMSGNWKEFLTGQLGWTVSSESLISKTAGHLSFKTLKKMMSERTPIDIAICLSEKAADGDVTKGAEWVKGKAVITALSMTAENGALCTSSCSLQGTGPLEDGDA